MLTQLKEGQYFLEDPTGAVPVDISKAVFTGGLFTENSFVLAEGQYEDGTFQVHALGFPPAEPAATTLQYFGNINFFGGPHSRSVKLSAKLKAQEENALDAMFVVLSDVWLDQIKVLEKLRILFAGYSEMPPVGFILMGNFLSQPKGWKDNQILKDSFGNLANLITEFPQLVDQSHFIFVPGPADPGLTNILPRPAIPNVLVQDFKKKIPNCSFCSNPCRIQFCTQEIIVFREDIISKICRNTIYMPWENETDINIPNLFVKTLVANAHLSPLPLSVAPIYWDFDYTMWMYPLPDVVICGDKYDSYSITNTGCLFFNPGSFPRTDYSFKVYIPSSRQVEDSQIAEAPS